MASSRKQFKIYGPDHFRLTWEKFVAICARDGTSASEAIRLFVEGQVAKRDPGNPQKTIGAYVEGHEDELAARRSDFIKDMILESEKRGGTLPRSLLVKFFRERYQVVGFRIVPMVTSILEDLEKLGVVVTY